MPVRRPGVSQSDTSTERMPLHGPVAVTPEVDVGPELRLRDRRQRPLGVDVDRVAVDDRHVSVEVEEHAVHPARDEAVEAFQTRVESAQRSGERPHDLHGQRGDVEVRCHRACRSGHAGDSAVLDEEPLHRGVEAHVDAEPAQVLHPRVDPGHVGRRVEHTIGPPTHSGQVEEELGEDQPTGSGADLLRPSRDQRASQAVGEELPERRRTAISADERPPALLLPLCVATFVAARQQRQQPLEQHSLFSGGDAHRFRPCQQEAADDGELVDR